MNTVRPGAVATTMTKGLEADPALKKAVEDSIPMGWLGQPEEIAEIALWRMSPSSSLVTGANIDAGWGRLQCCGFHLSEIERGKGRQTMLLATDDRSQQSSAFDEMRPDDDGWYHDRFVNSNEHDTIINYAAMAEMGIYSMDELRTMRADGSPIDQSPIEWARGFEITSGSLGTGVSQAAGIALGERKKGSDKRVICLLSDGELHESSVWEAFMFAAH